MSTLIARIVLATTSASAPPASAAAATSGISPVLGVSLAQSGRSVAARSFCITCRVVCGRMAKARPSSSRLGQEILTSMAATPGTVTLRQSSANSSGVFAEIDTISGAVNAA
jgi:hypothetical protein